MLKIYFIFLTPQSVHCAFHDIFFYPFFTTQKAGVKKLNKKWSKNTFSNLNLALIKCVIVG